MDEAFERAQEDAEREIQAEMREKCTKMLQFFLDNQDLVFQVASAWVSQRESIVTAFQNGILLIKRYDTYPSNIRAIIDNQASEDLETYWDFYQDLLDRQKSIGNN